MSRRFLTGLVSIVLLLILVLGATTAQDDRPIVVNWWSEPSNVDIHSFGTDGDSDIRFAVYAPLIRRATHEGPYPNTSISASGDYVAALAESWDVDDAAGTVTFHLIPDATFASGNPVTAEDVRWTVERGFLSPTSYMSALMPLGGLPDADHVEVVDDHTVMFTTANGVTPMFYELLSIVNMSILDKNAILEHATDEDPYATEWLPLNAAASGPYILTSAEPGVEFVLEPNPNYFEADYPRNSGIIFKVIPTAADRLLLLRSGELDVLRGVPYSEVDALKEAEGITVLDYPSTDQRAIALNNNIPPFDNETVRQAIAYAIPYDDIIQTVWSGYAAPMRSIVPEGMPTSDSSVWHYDTDLDMARQLLADAGFADGFETTLFTRADNQDDQAIAVVVQDALREIGVTVNIESLTSGAYAARQFGDRDMPMHFFDWISYVNDPFYHFNWLMHCEQGTNYANYCNPDVDVLIDEGLVETDPDRRSEISLQLQQMHADSATWIYLSQPNSITAMRSDIQGWTEAPDRIANYWTLWRGES
jgi:peptide/nickel transport system substrate-binding protein